MQIHEAIAILTRLVTYNEKLNLQVDLDNLIDLEPSLYSTIKLSQQALNTCKTELLKEERNV